MNGGLVILHRQKRFVGFNRDSKSLDSDLHRKYIDGGHVAAYMKVRTIGANYLFDHLLYSVGVIFSRLHFLERYLTIFINVK